MNQTPQSARAAFTTPDRIVVALNYRSDGRITRASARALRGHGFKRCMRCKQIKSHDAFSRHVAAVDGLNHSCRACDARKAVEGHARNRERNATRDPYADPTPKTCPRCSRDLPRTAFPRQQQTKDGLRAWCRECRSADPKQIARNRSPRMRAYQHIYGATARGVATRLRTAHGLDRPTSQQWAGILTNPNTRCAICGVPNWKLPRLGYWKIGGARLNRRLALDHIRPGDNAGGFRPLCCSCNRTRGAAELSDGEVLLILRAWYRDLFSLRKLWWLNSRVENGVCVGGREHRNETMRRKLEALQHVQ
jgi:hypothetical protein